MSVTTCIKFRNHNILKCAFPRRALCLSLVIHPGAAALPWWLRERKRVLLLSHTRALLVRPRPCGLCLWHFCRSSTRVDCCTELPRGMHAKYSVPHGRRMLEYSVPQGEEALSGFLAR